jgi:hypothetical protein
MAEGRPKPTPRTRALPKGLRVISASSRLRLVLEAEQAAARTVRQLADGTAAPRVRACLEELHTATLWVWEGLAKRMPRAARRRSTAADAFADLIDQVMRAPSLVDRLRLLNRHQRRVLRRIEDLLHEDLDGDLRVFLEGAHVIVGRTVAGCDDTIAELDREREVCREGDECRPGRSS